MEGKQHRRGALERWVVYFMGTVYESIEK